MAKNHVLDVSNSPGKAFAYKMRYDAMRRQGQRSDLTSSRIGTKLQEGRADDELADKVGESRGQL